MSGTRADLRSAIGVVLVLVIAGTPAAAANHRIEENPEQETPRHPDGPERGIRTAGIGAVREVVPPESAPAESLSAADTEPMPLAGITRKISGTPMAGSVTAFRVAPNGSRVVFIANKDNVALFELYSAPSDGSAPPVKISAGLPFGAGDQGVSAFQISPDSARVVFLADAHHTGGVSDIYSAPTNGAAAAIRLNLGPEAPVSAFGITPNSAHAVFFGLEATGLLGSTELYAAAAGTASSARQLSDVGLGNTAGDVVAADFSPDGSRILYAADATADEVFQWHSVLTGAIGPGFDVLLSAALTSVTLGRITPDSSRLVYAADETTSGKYEIFSMPLAGGARIKLNPAMAGVGASDLAISPNGQRVGYLADQNALGITEVYSALTTTAASGIRVSLPMSGSQGALTLTFSPDSSRIIYEADQTTPGTIDLFAVPSAGGTPITLHALTPPADAGQFTDLGTPIIGTRAVYPVFGTTVSLFSVPYDGALPFQQVSLPPSPGDILRNAFLPTSATRLMAYGAGPSAGSIVDEVQVVAVRGDLAAEPIHQTVGAGEQGVLGYEITSDEKFAIYRQDADTGGKPELYSYELDSDGDGILGASDNCRYVSNPSQQPVVFAPTLIALNSTTFDWTGVFDVRVVRGLISKVKVYEVLETAYLTDASGFAATGTPPMGDGWYYVVAHDCPGRSYQTSVGAEPGRDTAFP